MAFGLGSGSSGAARFPSPFNVRCTRPLRKSGEVLESREAERSRSFFGDAPIHPPLERLVLDASAA